MRSLQIGLMMILILGGSQWCANAQDPDRPPDRPEEPVLSHFQQVGSFLQNEVMDRVLEEKFLLPSKDRDFETDVVRRTTVFRVDIGDREDLAFDMHVQTKESSYVVENGMRRAQPTRVTMATAVVRITLRLGDATRLVGSAQRLTASYMERAYWDDAVEVSIQGNKLKIVRRTPLYERLYPDRFKAYTGGSTITQELSVVNNKLVSNSTEVKFRVDPDTLERTRLPGETKIQGAQVDGRSR